MRVKYMTKGEAMFNAVNLSQYPNFSASGSIRGMKEKYYGKDAFLVRCGSYIYNVPRSIYNLAH